MSYTFEDAKQEVAKMRKCEDWGFMMAAYEGVSAFKPEEWLSETVAKAYAEAAELLAQHRANEAVSRDRGLIVNEQKTLITWEGYLDPENLKCIPLPYTFDQP